MLQVKNSTPKGCTYLGKGFVDHPEMGVVVECREVVFDTWDVMYGHWTGKNEKTITMVRTDTGFAFDERDIWDGRYELEQYAPSWRAHKKDAWGLF